MTTVLYLKIFHLFFMVAWFAGIFYLPRLFVYHSMAKNEAVKAQLCVMERRLLLFVTPFAVLTWMMGIALIHQYGMPWFKGAIWLHIKLVLVILLSLYHGYCFVLLRQFAQWRNIRSDKFYRVFNEMPVLILLAVLFLAVFKI